MILLAILLAQTGAQEATAQEFTICSKQDDQPYRFCLADRKYERARQDLAIAYAKAQRAATAHRREIAEFSRTNGGVTQSGDPVQALVTAQRAWTRSYQADCAVVGLAVATGNAGTEGVTKSRDCEADRLFERVRFLRDAYPSKR